MLAFRSPKAGVGAHSEALSVKFFNHNNPHKRFFSQMPIGTCGRVLTVPVFAKKDHKDNQVFEEIAYRHTGSAELQAYIERERLLLSELVAARGQVDKLLDQQRLLLDMIARLSGLGGLSAQIPSVAGTTTPDPTVVQSPSPQQYTAPVAHRSSSEAPATASSLPPPPATSSARAPGRSSSSRSNLSDVPALNSLADLFKSAAATSPQPANAVAAASIAAAISAVDNGDILSINTFNIPAPTVTQPPLAATAAPSLPEPSLLFDTVGGFTSTAASESAAPSPTSPGKAAAGGAADDLLVEVAKAAPTDPPPELVQGDDDIFWLSRLHSALEERGFFPGDDDMETWFFGETTLAAVLSFQASERLPETGIVDCVTWTALLGAEVAEQLYGKTPVAPSSTSTATGSAAAAAVTAPSPSAPSTSGRGGASASTPSGSPPTCLTKWPVLMEGDGGREVHALQVALANNGFHCGEDDMRWWQFGEFTLTALKYFQSCSSLPESGVCDERSWRTLLGPDAAPKDLYELRLAVLNSDDEDGGYEDDMDGSSQGRVWLLGEQRWERRAK